MKSRPVLSVFIYSATSIARFSIRIRKKERGTTHTSTTSHLNLPFLANFYKLTGMSVTTTTDYSGFQN